MLPGTQGTQWSWADGAGSGGDRGSGVLGMLQPWEGSPGGGESPSSGTAGLRRTWLWPSRSGTGDSPAPMGTRGPSGCGVYKDQHQVPSLKPAAWKMLGFCLTFVPWSIQERLTVSRDVVSASSYHGRRNRLLHSSFTNTMAFYSLERVMWQPKGCFSRQRLTPAPMSPPLGNKHSEICLTTHVQSNGTEMHCYEGEMWL